MKRRISLQSLLLLIGSFTFVFLLGEAVHESGHWLAHQFYNNEGVGMHIDPFGGSHITGVGALPMAVMGVTSLAGPLFNLLLGVVLSILVFPRRSPLSLPFVLWGPVAMVQEGVTFSLGLLTPGGDAAWVATAMGIPQGVILAFGIGLLLAGLAGITTLLPVAGIGVETPFGGKLLVVLVGFGFLMLIRSIYAFFSAPDLVVENLVPLIFAFLLSILLALGCKPLWGWLGRRMDLRTRTVSWGAATLALCLGAVMFFVQMVAVA